MVELRCGDAYETFAFGFQVLTMLTASRECQVGTLSSDPLIQPSRSIPVPVIVRELRPLFRVKRQGDAYPWMAKMGVCTTLERKRSLSSGVNEVSRIARTKGSMKCADL